MHTRKPGFTIIESVVGIAIFLIIAIGIYQSFGTLMRGVRTARARVVALSIIDEEIELVRNLQFSDVGIVAGIPSGKLAHTSTVSRGGFDFVITRTVKNTDDPFDGTFFGVGPSHDAAPADYRNVEIQVDCTSCNNAMHLEETTFAAPPNLELTDPDAGVLVVRVCDANGNQVPDAAIHIENKILVPTRVVDDVTNNNPQSCLLGLGNYLLLDAPVGAGYHASTTKTGFTSDNTLPSTVGNPNPTEPDQGVAAGLTATQMTLYIDRVSSFQVSTQNQVCSAIPNVQVHVDGAELIGQNPDVLRYSISTTTDADGLRSMLNMKWDLYNFTVPDPAYDLAGTIPLVPFNLVPNASQNMQLILEPKQAKSLLVAVKDEASKLPLTDATVELSKTGGGYSEDVVTGRGTLSQTDWSGGAGQAMFTDPLKFFNSDTNIAINTPAGELKLLKVGADYQPSGWLESSTFDTGGVNNFYNVSWLPTGQPPETGTDPVKFQIASNNDNATWNYVGPDNTPASYYTLANTDMSNHNGRRYLRYKVFLSTVDQSKTPDISDITFSFTSSCIPPGQAFFNNLSSGTYDLKVTKSGYQDDDSIVQINTDYQTTAVLMNP